MEEKKREKNDGFQEIYSGLKRGEKDKTIKRKEENAQKARLRIFFIFLHGKKLREKKKEMMGSTQIPFPTYLYLVCKKVNQMYC